MTKRNGPPQRGAESLRASSTVADGSAFVRESDGAGGAAFIRESDGAGGAAFIRGADGTGGAGFVRESDGSYATRGLGHPILDRLVEAARRLRRCEAVLVRAEAATLAYLAAARRYRDLGVSSLATLAREHLQIAPRTLKNRLSLERMCEASPRLERAFMDGELSGCQVLALRPLFARRRAEASAGGGPRAEAQPGVDAGADARIDAGIEVETWIARAAELPVRELRARLNEATGEGNEETSDERAFEFFAPIEFRVVFDQMCDLARRVMGYDAPQARCIEAILEETGYRGRGARPGPDARATAGPEADARALASGGPGADAPARTLPGSGSFAPPPGTVARPRPARPLIPPSAGVVARAEEILRKAEAALAGMRPLVEAQAPRDAEDALVRLVALQRQGRPVRYLLSQIVACLQAAGVDPDAAESALGFCPRTLRNLAKQGHLLNDAPLLEKAYRLRVLSSAAVQIVHRMAPNGAGQKDWLARARGVTARQLSREGRFFDLLRLADRTLAARFPGPFPAPGLEEALRERLRQHGHDDAAMNARLAERGILATDPPAAGGPAALGGATSAAAMDHAGEPDATDAIAIDPATDPDATSAIDPASDPNTMRRLEALLETLVLTEWEDPPTPGEGLSPSVRKTFAPVREMRVRWILPIDVIADLRLAIKEEADRWPVPLPTWAALIGVLAQAQSVWGQQDPDRKPVWSKILKRDEYRCQVPGCTARRMLMVHHLRFRSRGGRDLVWNLFTLCHPCHAYGIHEDRIRARGRAPGGVIWELGCRAGRLPILILHGERILMRRIG